MPIAVIGSLFAVLGCGAQGDADQEAAGYADRVLPAAIDQKLRAVSASDPRQRAEKVETWLQGRGSGALRPPGRFSWDGVRRDGAAVRVVVFHRWEAGMRPGPQITWGRACREYVIAARASPRVIDCSWAPPSPPATAVGPA